MIFGCTNGALDKQQVAIVIGAVGMGVAGCAALVALGNNVVGDALAQTLIEHKVFSFEKRG